MQNHIDKPTVRQAAEMMPAGPDREALHARAREFYDAGQGPFIERRIAAVQRSLEMIWAAQEAQQKAAPGQPLVQAREHLRYENQLDRLYRSHDALWEDAFKSAREAIFRESRKRLATPVYEVDETLVQYEDRLAAQLAYAGRRPKLDRYMAGSKLPGLERGHFSWTQDLPADAAKETTLTGQAAPAGAA
jgi:hypothetical protein